MKKLTALALAITMLLTLLTGNISAVENEFVFGDGYSDYYWNSEFNLGVGEDLAQQGMYDIFPMTLDGPTSGQCGDNAYWYIDEDTKTLTIYGSGDMWDYDFNRKRPPWAYNDFQKVCITGQVTSIGDYAFYIFYYDSINSVEISSNITKIGMYSFDGCSHLTNITIPNSVITIGRKAFSDTGLESITLPNNLDYIGAYAFYSDSSISNLYIPQTVSYIGESAFYQIGSITVAPTNTNFYIQDDMLFSKEPSGLRLIWTKPSKTGSVTLSSEVTKIDRFSLSDGITDVTIFGHIFDTYFHAPVKLKSIVFSSVSTINSYTFDSRKELSHVELPNNLVEIQYAAFYKCTSLNDIIIPASVQSIEDHVFIDSAKSIYFEGNAPSVYDCNAPTSNPIYGWLEYVGSFDKTATLYYKPGTTGWIDSPYYDPSTGKWNGYTLLPWEDSASGKYVSLKPENGTIDYGYVSASKNNVGFDEFTITFSKKLLIGNSYMNYQHYAPMNLDKGTISLYNSSGELVWKAESTKYDEPGCTSSVVVSSDQYTLIIKPTNSHDLLDYETDYYIAVDPGVIQFEDGTTFDGISKGEWRFRTLEKVLSPKEPLKIDNALFNYCSAITGKTASYYFDYDEAWFNQDATIYNHDLAKTSLKLAMAAANTTPDYVEDLFNKLEIDENDRVISYPYPTRDTIGYAIGGKRLIDDSGNETTLIIVAIRGGGYLSEWADNFNVGLTSDHAGFMRAANTVKDAIYSYLEKIKPYSNLKVWVTGYSRAAAVTNILSERLTVEARSMYNTTGLSEKGIYSYSFETPRPTQSDVETFNNTYDNIFSIINPIDLVPKVAPATDGWNYDRYGITYYLPGNNTHSDYKKYESALTQKYTEVIKMAGVTDSEVETYLPENISQILYQADVFEGLVDGVAKFFVSPKAYVLGNQDMVTGAIESAMGEPKEPNKEISHVLDTFATVLPMMNPKFGLPSKIYKIIMETKDCLGYAHYPELCLSWLEAIDGHTVTDYCSRTRYRCITCNCPVDINVYDSQGNLVAAIVNNEVQKIEGSYIGAYIDVDGQKKIILPEDEEYDVKILASDAGQMTYTVIEHDISSGQNEKVVSYYELDIEKGDTFVGTVENLDITESAQYPLFEDGEPIAPTVVQIGDDIKEYSVNVTTEGSGTSIGGGIYVNGEFAMVTAEADGGEEFLGWYIDGVNVSSDAEYRFLVDKDVTVTAKFTSSENNPIPQPPQHTHYFTNWQFDNTYHWIGCVGCGLQIDFGIHTFVNGVCSVCGCIDTSLAQVDKIEVDVATEGLIINEEEVNIIEP